VREGASLLTVLMQEESIVKFVIDCLMDGRNYLTPELIERISELYTLKNKKLQVYLFDTWTYKGAEDGDTRLKQLLDTLNFPNYSLFKGDSRNTLPVFLEEHPIRFDLVFVDGDHTLEVTWSDLMNLKDW